MMEYPFTRPEQQAIEQAAKRLKLVMTDADAEDAAYDIAQDIRQALIDTDEGMNVTIRYELCPVETNDGMWDHPTPRIRRDAFDGVWLLDGQHPGPTDEEVMRPIIDAALREDNER